MEVDKEMRDGQAGFRQWRSCACRLATRERLLYIELLNIPPSGRYITMQA